MQRWPKYSQRHARSRNLQIADEKQKAGIILHDGKTTPQAKDQSGCPLFTTIPVEIRHLIYRELLTTPEPIDRAHKQLGSKETAMLDQYQKIPNLDAPILRTCRTIYNEALPILYGLNTFQFASSQSIRYVKPSFSLNVQ